MTSSLRVYADTSVFGGICDVELCDGSISFFNDVRSGRISLVVSTVVLDELEGAPNRIRSFFHEMSSLIELVEIGDEAYALRKAYMQANIVGAKWEADALHVAVATVSDCRIIVSWNFKHIVNFRRIPLYNEINREEGYGPIAIHSPSEIVFNEEDRENI